MTSEDTPAGMMAAKVAEMDRLDAAKRGALTFEQLARVAELERRFKAGQLISMAESLEYTALKDIARRMTGPAETADDPATPFVDESRRPQLDGTDYNVTLKAMCCDEAKTLALKYGLPLLQAVVAGLK